MSEDVDVNRILAGVTSLRGSSSNSQSSPRKGQTDNSNPEKTSDGATKSQSGSLKTPSVNSSLPQDSGSGNTPSVSSTSNKRSSPSDDSLIHSSNYRPEQKIIRTSGSSQPTPVGGTHKGPSSGVNSVIVSESQKLNPLLNKIRNVPWQFYDRTISGEPMRADYIVGANTCVLFLSLKYHRIKPEYIFTRISKLGRYNFLCRILLVLVDVENHEDSIKQLTKTSIVNDLTLLLAWSFEEAANYISLLKSQEKVPPTAIQGIKKDEYSTRIVESLTAIQGINKNDAISLVSTFGSLREAINDEGRTAEQIGGWGETKAKRFQKVVTDPFLYDSNA